MVFTARPDSFTTSTKVTPSGVPSIGDLGPFSAGRSLTCCGRASASRSENGSTSAVRLKERINRRRLLYKIETPKTSTMTGSRGIRLACAGKLVVHVPGYALNRNLRVFTQIVERVSGRTGIDLLGGEQGGLLGGFLLHPEPAIDDGQTVVSREIVGIDRLQGFKLLFRLLVFMLLVVRDAEFAA